MNLKKLLCKVRSPSKEYLFTAWAHECPTQENQVIPPEFYLDNEVPVPSGTHWEVQIEHISIPKDFLVSGINLHIYKHPVLNTDFMCWVYQLKTLPDAMNQFRIWCAGSAFTMENGIDFAKLNLGEEENLEAHLYEHHGVYVTSAQVKKK